MDVKLTSIMDLRNLVLSTIVHFIFINYIYVCISQRKCLARSF